jgi:acetolactate synthase-1/3 small subunit
MSVYEKEELIKGNNIKSHALAVLVDNQAGALARVVGMFSARGYNIDSLTVAKVTTDENISRITIVTSGTLMKIEQIKSQLGRIVVVHKVVDLTSEGPFCF